MSYKYLFKCLQLTYPSISRGFIQHTGTNLVTLRRTNFNSYYTILKHDLRQIHMSYPLSNKEITTDSSRPKNDVQNVITSINIEKFKDSVQTNQNMKSAKETKSVQVEESTVAVNNKQEVTPVKKLTIWQRVKKEFWHYYHGFKLFFLELKVTLGILNTLTKGQSLTRRERKQLVRTTADLARMIPFLVFIIIPFMEFLLPFYIKFFPFMMPSPFQEDSKKSDKTRQILKGKLEIAKFLQETLSESTRVQKETPEQKVNMQTFSEFLKKARESGLTANTEDILRFSQLFEDEITLESLQHSQLKALCKMLELNVIGPPTLLRFQLRMKVRHLKVDDQLIKSEGIDKIPVWELQQLCRERGMRSIGVSEERLRYQLDQWLSLHLDKKVPITLLLLTRIIYLPETLTPEEKLKQAILKLPTSVSNEAKLKAVTTEGVVDHKTKFEVIKEEQKVIKKEREEAKKAAKPTEDKAPIIKPTPAQTDLAPEVKIPSVTAEDIPITPVIKIGEAAKDTAPLVKPEISIKDLSQIESAIVKLKETKEIFTKEELEDLKEDREDTLKEIPKVVATAPIDKAKNAAADRLGAKVDKMISELDKMVDKLHEEDGGEPLAAGKKKMEVGGGDSEKKMAATGPVKNAEQERFISIADLKMILRQMDKMPDDAKWQQILNVLDEDGDGMIEMDHVLKMTQLLGAENVKLTKEEAVELLEMLDKEAIVAESKKTNPAVPPSDKK